MMTRSQNSRSVIAAITASKRKRCSSSTPRRSSAIWRCAGVINRKGGASGWKCRRGAGSNVATPSGAPSRFAATLALSTTAR